MKKPARKHQQKPTPAAPPQSLGDAVLGEALSRVTDRNLATYAAGLYIKSDMTEAERKAFCESMMNLAALGFAYYNHVHDRPEQS